MEGLLEKAWMVFETNHGNTCSFERAIFLSWYCSKGDCAFCYMSTQKDLIKDPKRSRRSMASIFAECLISKACGWEIEFLSGGYDSFEIDELIFIAETIFRITGKKQWLNIGTLDKDELKRFSQFIEGFVGTLECVNPGIRKTVCPSKPLSDIEKSFSHCDELELKKAITVIIGLGETLDDFSYLKDYIEKNKIDRITFYSLNPQQGTPFKKSPSIDYYEKWIAMTRIAFPSLIIVAGAWYDKTEYFSRLLLAGANNITKFPAIKHFNTEHAKAIEKEIISAGRIFTGTLTKYPGINIDSEISKLDIGDDLKDEVRKKSFQYLDRMRKGI